LRSIAVACLWQFVFEKRNAVQPRKQNLGLTEKKNNMYGNLNSKKKCCTGWEQIWVLPRGLSKKEGMAN